MPPTYCSTTLPIPSWFQTLKHFVHRCLIQLQLPAQPADRGVWFLNPNLSEPHPTRLLTHLRLPVRAAWRHSNLSLEHWVLSHRCYFFPILCCGHLPKGAQFVTDHQWLIVALHLSAEQAVYRESQ